MCAPGAHPVILAACALCGADARLPDGRRAGGRRAGLRDRDGPARRRHRRAGQPLRPGGQAAGQRRRRDRRLRRAQRRARARHRRRRPARSSPLDLAAQAEHGAGHDRRARSATTRRCSTPSTLRPAARRPPALVDAPGLEAALAFAEAFAPEHLELVGAAAEALAPRVRSAGCLFVGREGGDRVRRLRRGLEPHAAHRRRGALRLRRSGRAHFRRRMSEVRIGAAAGALARAGRADRAGRGLRAPRSVDGGSGECRARDAHRRHHPPHRRDRRRAHARPRRLRARATRSTGVGFLDHMLDLVARHGRLDLDVDGHAATSRRARTTPSRTSASCSARRSTSALGDRAGITRYGHAVVPMDESRASLRDRHLRPPVLLASRARCCRPGETGGFDHELAEEFFRAVATSARLTLHITIEAGTNAHHMIEAPSRRSPARCARPSPSTRPRPACPRRRGR